ncbi:hypothetical protein D3C73_735280 [compost metagenome]
MGDGAAKAQDEQPGGQRGHHVCDGGRAVCQVAAEAGDQSRVVQGFAEGGKAADQPERAKGLMAQDVQGAMAMRAVEQGEGNDADRRKTGADHQRVGQHHGQAFTQRRGQCVAHVHGDHQGNHPGAEFAQGKAQHVESPGVLRQFLRQAEAHPHPMAQPYQRGSQQAPQRQDHGEAEDDRQPFIGRQYQRLQFVIGQGKFPCPAGNRAVGTGKLLLEAVQRAADQAQHTFLAGWLGFSGGVAQLFQVGQQLGALLVVLQRFNDLVQRLAEGFLCLRLCVGGAIEQARQAHCLGWRDRQQGQEAEEQQAGQGKQTSEH